MRVSAAFLLIILLGAVLSPVTARPPFLEMFRADPFRIASVDSCAACHVNPLGGGPRNPFGLAFAESGQTITPLLRANFPDRFTVNTAKLADGSTLYFSDPKSQSIVLERDKQKRVIDLSPATAAAANKAEPKPKTKLSFFVTSTGGGKGGSLGGIAGADRHCQTLAAAAGAGDRSWRAYLSTSLEGRPILNAGDRIGSGPWYNAKGLLIARGVTDLHSANSKLNAQTALTEKGDPVSLQEIITGTRPDGTASEMTCGNWTSSDAGSTTFWNSTRTSQACSQESFQSSGGAGQFLCFAVD